MLKSLEATPYYFIDAVAISPDGRFLVAGDHKGSIFVWSLPDATPLMNLAAHTGWALSLAISPDSRILASGSTDKSVRLWSLPDLKPLGSCLVDLSATPPTAQGMQYRQNGLVYTLPCGAPLPTGAICTCNCVPGAGGCACISTGGCTSTGGCSCVPVTYYYPN